MHSVVVTFDRLPAGFLGCYGNEWIETPGFDRLAAESAVFNRHFVEIPATAGSNHPWWTGAGEFFLPKFTAGEPTIPEILARNGVRCRMISERSDGLPPAGIESFETVEGRDDLDVEHSHVPFARLIERATDVMADELSPSAEPSLLWLHSRGVPDPWLPPEFFAGLYLDELEDDNESGESGSEIAAGLLAQFASDPDLVSLLLSEQQKPDDDDEAATYAGFGEFGLQVSRYVFAGYVSLVDHFMKKLLAELEKLDSDVLLIVTAAEGRDFGERLPFLGGAKTRDGAESESTLCSTLVHTPLILWNASRQNRQGVRHDTIAQPSDVPATLFEWFSIAHAIPDGESLLPAFSDEIPKAREFAVHLSPHGEIGIRDDDWFLVADEQSVLEPGAVGDAIDDADIEERIKLFAKPDDVWDVNNVARDYPNECIRLAEALRTRIPVDQL